MQKALICNLMMCMFRGVFYLLLYILLLFNNMLYLFCAKHWNNNFVAHYLTDCFQVRMMKIESRLPGEISVTSDMLMTPLYWQKAKRK